MIKDFALPDLGEGLTESEIVSWHVAVGDRVTLNQPLAEVETAKAIVQLPSPFAGVIAALYVEPGTTVSVGSPIVAIETEVTVDAVASTPVPERNAVLVGYGPAVETGARPKRKVRKVAPQAEPSASPVGHIQVMPMSTPPVRKLAHDLGVNLALVAGTGEGGAITREDVQGAASAAPMAPAAPAAPAATATSGARETRTPVKGVRKHTAAAMVASAFTAPHVTEFLDVDVTRTVELVARLKARGELASVLAVVAKALCLAVSRNPSLNSKWDEAAGEIVEFGYVNLGIAVATDRGLMVPNIPDAHTLALGELTTAITELAAAARSGTTTPKALSGGTITISNVGVFGIDAGTPILNPGEAAILATGAVRKRPWEHEGGIALRDVMTLSLSFDHRLVDGEQGARFLVDIGRILEDPGSVLLLG
jgi:2-oxoisovalerate dehydrogenase E2 component (dihydrolipoyl transacylase)